MARLARFLEPPRLRTIDDEGDERRATWLELFFDLVFVVAVAQASSLLTDHLTAGRFFGYLGVFVAIWWMWMASRSTRIVSIPTTFPTVSSPCSRCSGSERSL